MDLYLKVRLACSEGMSQREAAKHFNLSRDTVRKMLSFSVPPGYRRQAEIKRNRDFRALRGTTATKVCTSVELCSLKAEEVLRRQFRHI